VFYGLGGIARQLNGLPAFRFSPESELGVSETIADLKVLDKNRNGVVTDMTERGLLESDVALRRRWPGGTQAIATGDVQHAYTLALFPRLGVKAFRRPSVAYGGEARHNTNSEHNNEMNRTRHASMTRTGKQELIG
jgi:hypothetical protein